MFQDSWKEEDGKPLSIDDYDGDTVQAFVDFIYDGRIYDESKLNIQLLAISHFYQVFPFPRSSPISVPIFLSFQTLFFGSKVECLVKLCSQHLLSQAITEDNAIQMWCAAELYEMDRLRGQVFKFMEANWQEMKHSPEMKKLPREYIDAFIDYLI